MSLRKIQRSRPVSQSLLLSFERTVQFFWHHTQADSLSLAVDFFGLSRTPEWTSKQGFWSNDPACLHARAKYVRRWLRDRPETHIALVSHVNFLRYLISRAKTDDLFANGEIRRWVCCQVYRTFLSDASQADCLLYFSYTFKENDDEDASLVLLETKAKVGEVNATSDFDAGGVAKA